jgi:hypothetical protein
MVPFSPNIYFIHNEILNDTSVRGHTDVEYTVALSFSYAGRFSFLCSLVPPLACRDAESPYKRIL